MNIGHLTTVCLFVSIIWPSIAGAVDYSPELLDEFRPIGGGGNNLDNPALNAIPGRPERSLAPPHFAENTGNTPVDGPNARTISNVISGGVGANGQDANTLDPRASAWLYVFGQFVDHDVNLETTSSAPAAIAIPVLAGDPFFPPGSDIAVPHNDLSPTSNTMVSALAGYLDLSQLYGSTTDVAASLRNADGTLASSNSGRSLPLKDGMFVSGDQRVMENPQLTALTTLFMREHNYWVKLLKTYHSRWSGDELYDMARAITTAEYQNIIYNEFLPILIGPVLKPYKGYDSTVDAEVSEEFSAGAFRVGQSQIADTQEGVDTKGDTIFTESLAQAFFNNAADDEANGIDAVLRAIGMNAAQATDVYVVSTLRNLAFTPLEPGDIDALDLVAVDIQHERNVGLATLNQTREALGLKPHKSFAGVTSDPVLQRNLKNLYGNIDDLDLFIGGLAEDHVANATVGQTFQAIIAEQFDALRAGDRFYWRNQNFDAGLAFAISRATLAAVLGRNLDAPNVQAMAFVAPFPNLHAREHEWEQDLNTHDRKGPPFMVR